LHKFYIWNTGTMEKWMKESIPTLQFSISQIGVTTWYSKQFM